ncbi:sulfite exporter TauE/SafE family protein [Catenovulum sp. 2E275]|uniref:sulfite exporter TauE/SafE family protein n=1 Tax=Catenovulum sp. 2E275 TaxID=2980497 RepID=UPI0021D31E35|nr:sulfite exporter TauE/SafE family protein [Catenovulum sp. 2E275]MCU4677358.1 sulfite exporter TauE/SafE family protein [Catenovulum sp. 2E275]
MSFEIIVLVNCIVMIGTLIQGIIGYGIGMFCAPLLFMINPEYVPAPMVLLSTVLTVSMLLRDKSDLKVDQVSWTMLGGFFGVVIAGIILNQVSLQQFQIVFGLLILLAVIISIIGYTPKINKLNTCIAGYLSGFMGTLTAVGGPPVALLYQRVKAAQLKANLSAFFLFLNVIIVTTLIWIDKLTLNSLVLVAVAIPGLFIGFYLSGLVARFINPQQLRIFILIFSTLSGFASIIKAFI